MTIDLSLMDNGALHYVYHEKNLIFYEDTVVVWLVDGLRALQFFADKGIIHFDIKPANLLLDSNFRLRIGDMGLAEQSPN